MQVRIQRGAVLFEYGFRPFFLLAGMMAFLSVGVWMAVYAGWLEPNWALPAPWWHAHEMIFGFMAAAAAGFLLTATPNWTGAQPVRGARLAFMGTLWIAGRLAGLSPWPGTLWVGAAVDAGFFSLFAVSVAAPMWRTDTSYHRWPPVILLGLLTTADALVHAELLGWLVGSARVGFYAGLDTILMLGVIIGGRLMPRLTQGVLQAQGLSVTIQPRPRLEAILLVAMLGVILTDLFFLDHPVNGGAVLLAAAVYAVRLAGWYPFKYAVPPLLWVLRVGFLWLVVGLTLRGIAQLTGILSLATAIHAVTIGAMATLTLGIMTRVTLAHSGRPPLPPKFLVVGFLCLPLAALARVVVTPFAPDWGIGLSGVLWLTGFMLFVLFSFPLLISPARRSP